MKNKSIYMVAGFVGLYAIIFLILIYNLYGLPTPSDFIAPFFYPTLIIFLIFSQLLINLESEFWYNFLTIILTISFFVILGVLIGWRINKNKKIKFKKLIKPTWKKIIISVILTFLWNIARLIFLTTFCSCRELPKNCFYYLRYQIFPFVNMPCCDCVSLIDVFSTYLFNLVIPIIVFYVIISLLNINIIKRIKINEREK